MKFFLALQIGLWLLVPHVHAQSAAPSPMEWIRNDRYQVQYQVPASWQVAMNAHDSAAVVTHVDPSGQILLVVAKLRDGARHHSPHEALDNLLLQFGVQGNKRYRTKYNGIEFIETTGVGTLNGQLLRYDALAAHHRGHVLLVYLYAPPTAFADQDVLLTQVLHSFSPYRRGR